MWCTKGLPGRGFVLAAVARQYFSISRVRYIDTAPPQAVSPVGYNMLMNKAFLHISRRLALALVLGTSLMCALPARGASRLNDKLLNRPYSDMRKFHLGFSVGMNTFGMSFHHNGFVGDNGETWFMSQPSYSPGFCVNGLFSVRLNDYFSLRVSPGLWFGNRVINFLDTTNGTKARQDLKSAYLVLPVDIKFAAQRMRNLRPYVVAGVVPAFDVMKKRSDYIMTKTFDPMVSVGFGCDFYLPYFKLIPELKFCFGLADIIKHDRPDLVEDPVKTMVANSVKRATNKMVVLTFYFE